MKEYQKCINAEVENYVSTLLDTWQCCDWGVPVRDFFNEWIKQFGELCNKLTNELEEYEREFEE